MRIETKAVPVCLYVSDDGSEFETEDECREHEELLQKVREMVLPDSPGMPSVCGYDGEGCTFTWYRTGSQEDLGLLEEYFGAGLFEEEEAEQAIHDGVVCIAQAEEADYDLPIFTLSGIMEAFRNWTGNFGYETEFRKQAEEGNSPAE